MDPFHQNTISNMAAVPPFFDIAHHLETWYNVCDLYKKLWAISLSDFMGLFLLLTCLRKKSFSGLDLKELFSPLYTKLFHLIFHGRYPSFVSHFSCQLPSLSNKYCKFVSKCTLITICIYYVTICCQSDYLTAEIE